MVDRRDGEAEARGEARGKITEAINLYREEMKLSPSEILKKIVSRYSLQERQAREYVESTLNVKLA